MVNKKTIGKKIKNGAVSIAPYILANAGVAFVADSGIDAVNQVVNLPDVVDNTLFYTNLGLFNLGVVYPIATQGFSNFGRKLIGKNSGEIIIGNKARVAVLIGLSALVVAGGRNVLHNVKSYVETPIEQVVFESDANTNSEGNVELEGNIQSYVNELRKKGLARRRGVEDYAIYMKDFVNDEVFVEMNADRQQMGASTLKLFVMAAGFEAINDGKLIYDSKTKKDIEAMICRSNNSATNKLIKKIGLEYINKFARKYGFGLTVVDLIPKNGRTLNNKTSARDLGDLIEEIYEGRLHGSDEMKRILALDCNGHSDRLVDKTCIPVNKKDLHNIGGFVDEVYGKSGTTYGVNAYAGVVETKFLSEDSVHPYVVVIMIEDETAKNDRSRGNYSIWGTRKSETLRSISEAGYWFMHKKYSDMDGYKCKQHKGVHPQ